MPGTSLGMELPCYECNGMVLLPTYRQLMASGRKFGRNRTGDPLRKTAAPAASLPGHSAEQPAASPPAQVPPKPRFTPTRQSPPEPSPASLEKPKNPDPDDFLIVGENPEPDDLDDLPTLPQLSETQLSRLQDPDPEGDSPAEKPHDSPAIAQPPTGSEAIDETPDPQSPPAPAIPPKRKSTKEIPTRSPGSGPGPLPAPTIKPLPRDVLPTEKNPPPEPGQTVLPVKRATPRPLGNQRKEDQSKDAAAEKKPPGIVKKRERPVRPTLIMDEEGERRKLISSAGHRSRGAIAPVAGMDLVMFRCMDCTQQNMAPKSLMGKEHTCPECGAIMALPGQDDPFAKIKLLRRGNTTDTQKLLIQSLPKPSEGIHPGPTGKIEVHEVREIEPDREDASDWGLVDEDEESRERTSWRLAITALILLGITIAILVVQSGSGVVRVSDDVEGLENPTEAGMQARRAARSAEIRTVVTNYLGAPTLEEKAQWAVPREGLLDDMREFHSSLEYIAEIKEHGGVIEINDSNIRMIGETPVTLVSLLYQFGKTGVLAVVETEEGMRVDWDHATGFGDEEISNLAGQPKPGPLRMRGFLRWNNFHPAGFPQSEWTMFDFYDRDKIASVPVFVRKGSDAFLALRDIRRDKTIERLGVGRNVRPQHDLDVTIVLRHLDEPGRKGYVIEDVLSDSWIYLNPSP